MAVVTPIEQLAESQSWSRGKWSVAIGWREGRLHATIATVGRDGDLAADSTEAAWVEAAVAAVPGITREWGPDWIVPIEGFAELVAQLGGRLVSRTFNLTKWDPALVAELGAAWSVACYWTKPGGLALQIDVSSSGMVYLTGADPHRDALRAATGIDIPDAPLHRRVLEIAPADALAAVPGIGSFRPDDFSWCLAVVHFRDGA